MTDVDITPTPDDAADQIRDDLTGKVALVTGGANGLGLAIARALAEAGAHVVIADVDEEGGHAAADELGGPFVRTDVSDLQQNHDLVAAAVEAHGGLDLAVLNAGVATGTDLGESFDLAAYRRAMAINLDGVVFGIQACLPAMQARGAGSIVATASMAGLTGIPTDPLYGANKHAVVGLVRSAGPALATKGVRLNAICPGFADTAIVDPFRDALAAGGVALIRPEVVAGAAMDLLTGTASGECVVIQSGRAPEPFRFRGIPGPR